MFIRVMYSMEFYIYKITNIINGKCYIGKTRNYNKRFYQHSCGYYDSYISRALKKYGINKFTFEIVEKTEDCEKLSDLERKYIKEFNSLAPNGYNLIDYTGSSVIFSDLALKNRHKARNKKGSLGYYGVFHENRTCDKYETNVVFKGERFAKLFDTLIEAAEAYDKIIIFLYGLDAKINFPEKLPDYEKIDLVEYFNWFKHKKERSSKYIGVSFKSNCNKWAAYYYDNKKYISLGFFNSEIEAAETRDKCVLYLKLDNIKLNFPDKKTQFQLLDLKDIYLNSIIKKTSKHKGVSFCKKTNKWKAYARKDKKTLHLGYFSNEEEALQARQKALE